MHHAAWGGRAARSKRTGNGKGRDKACAASATAGIAAAVVCPFGGCASSPAMSAPIVNERVNVRSWLLGTGCRYDLTSRGAIPTSHGVLVTDAERPVTLSTANGYLLGDMADALQIGAFFGEEGNPYLLASTPEVLAIGVRCLRQRI